MTLLLQRIVDVKIPRDAKPWLFALSLLAIVVVASILLALVKRSMRGSLEKIAKRTSTHIDDLMLAVIDTTSFFFLLFLALWIAPLVVQVPRDARAPMQVTAIIALLIQLAIWVNAIISSLVDRVLSRGGTHASAATAATALAFVARLAVGAILLLIGLDNLGFNVTAMIAGLGIGGLVVALALQNLLRDLLGALAIVVGRPFLVGDVIESEKVVGTVEYVGMRSTQVRSPTGEEVFLPNNKLLDAALRNLSRRREFRAVINVVVSYDTSAATLGALPGQIKAIVMSKEATRFDGAFVKDLGPLGIEIEAVYYVVTTVYAQYMQTRHEINLAIMELLEREGVAIARPFPSLDGLASQ